MAAVSLLNVEVLKKVAEVTAPLELEITFECLESLQKGMAACLSDRDQFLAAWAVTLYHFSFLCFSRFSF